jgi:hypothetical protein
MRVLSSLSESEIKNVLKIRNGDPILPNEPTLVDLMIFNQLIDWLQLPVRKAVFLAYFRDTTFKGSTGRGRCISRLHEIYSQC